MLPCTKAAKYNAKIVAATVMSDGPSNIPYAAMNIMQRSIRITLTSIRYIVAFFGMDCSTLQYNRKANTLNTSKALPQPITGMSGNVPPKACTISMTSILVTTMSKPCVHANFTICLFVFIGQSSTHIVTLLFATSTKPLLISWVCSSSSLYRIVPSSRLEMMGAWFARTSKRPAFPGTCTLVTFPVKRTFSGEMMVRFIVLSLS